MRGSKSSPDARPERFSRQRQYLTLFIWVVGICLSFGMYTLLANALVRDTAGTAHNLPRPLPALDGAVVKIDPATRSVAPGATFTVAVMIQDVQNLGAFQFDVTFSSSVLTVTAVELGPFLGSTGRSVSPVAPIYGAGSVTYAAFSFGTNAGPNGDGVLATLTLQAKTAGTSPLHLQNVTLLDPDAGPISASAQDGAVTVGPIPPPSVASITPNWGYAGRVLGNVVVVGQNFQNGASVQLTKSGQSPILASWPTVQGSTRISCTLDLGKAVPGRWTVKVTNPDARWDDLPDGFTVKAVAYLPVVLKQY